MDYLHRTLTMQPNTVLPGSNAIVPAAAPLGLADAKSAAARTENFALKDGVRLGRKPLPAEQTLKPYGTLMLPYRGDDSRISVLA